jgi:hypothetical protein
MNPKYIFFPLYAQILLTFLVWGFMYFERIGEMKRKKVDTQKLANPTYAAEALKESTNSSDNFENLFEMPVLFYVAILTVYVLGYADFTYLVLASGFVFLRTLHSIIHCTYNRVIQRFWAYAFSTFFLVAIWIQIGVQLFRE